MSIVGCYYLHENGSLIYKPGTDCAADIRESDLARMLWFLDPADRMNAWSILVEACALGAKRERIDELAAKWFCDNDDADEFAKRAGITLSLDGNAWCATGPGFENLQESPAGFGDSKLKAMAELAKAIGYRPSKIWAKSFVDQLNGLAA